MACGNSMRAIRTLRNYPQSALEDLRSDAQQVDFSADGSGILTQGRQGPLGTTDSMARTDAGNEATSDSQNHVGVKQVAEPEGLPSTTTPTTAFGSMSSTAPKMTDEELLLAFPWLGNESNSEDCSDGEGADEDDDEFFKPVDRCRCEDLTKIRFGAHVVDN
eukprot:TRINITY_DN6381_c0_g1_i2.p1 TRINITY_DN6381_c0_g1~~TRINITY_DN6381_c0_g1_i2.p1  ORF type:complete len:175 (+),score=31.84 TRINITY_DN6381_c0_g1_i2:41-526(+)